MPKNYLWLIPAAAIVELLIAPFLAMKTVFGAFLAAGIGLAILKAWSEAKKEAALQNFIKGDDDDATHS